ncbi:Regulator of microtubule dynamics protein 2 [Triplophysa tibetana]|uniref:Regulator of microtubule dynamics protein 2 n=1 Tax=Triplophysa tibetana TaxID=1572043 RepID=A0A5A9P8J7_9TELE|nr:Regulator of microtubule dynamics protein 2 [Triplophysa tibetana]
MVLSLQLLTMAQADSRALALGVLAGAAGISLAVVCFRRVGAGGGRVPQLSSHVDHVDGRLGLLTGQSEVLDRLGALIHCVSELKEEVRALKEALPHLQDNVRDQLRGPSGNDVGARRASPLHRTPTRRKRAGVTERNEGQSSEDAESEGGYITALTDSDEEQSDEDQNRTVKEPVDELASLLQKADCLHSCNGTEKAQGLDLLLDKKEEYNEKCQYLWRLSRAYADAHDFAADLAEKKRCAEDEKRLRCESSPIKCNTIAAQSLCFWWDRINQFRSRCFFTNAPLIADLQYAILCGLLSEYESIQNKIKNGYLFKDHLDKAIELKPEDPLSYYLLGRWCYAVAQCTWIERKIAATLFGEPPSATVQDALQNFLKAEEISPKYSKYNYVFLVKCYKDMGQRTQARQMCDAASAMSVTTKEVLFSFR